MASGGIDIRGTGRVRWPIRTQIIQVPRWLGNQDYLKMWDGPQSRVAT